MTPRTITLTLAVALVAQTPRSAAARVTVVTTTQDPAALTRAVGGDRVEVTALAKGYQDPHFLEAKPSYMVLLHQADLVEVIGLDLEVGYIGALLSGAHNETIMPGKPGYLDLSQAIKPLEVVSAVDRAQGDIHPNGNPHYWLDPENGRLMARAIAARLTAIDPAGGAAYAANLAMFESALGSKEADWEKRLASLRGSPIITYHRSWSYFAARYGLLVIDFVEPKPGVPPAPMHTLELIKLIEDRQVKLILMEGFYDKRVPELLAQKTSARMVAVPNSVGGEDGVHTYIDLLEIIVATIERQSRN
jgi:zinc/manganese transport system substrate-binding protein